MITMIGEWIEKINGLYWVRQRNISSREAITKEIRIREHRTEGHKRCARTRLTTRTSSQKGKKQWKHVYVCECQKRRIESRRDNGRKEMDDERTS